MGPAGYGVYEVVAPAVAGDDCLFVVDGQSLPDPCSRSQPAGIRGPSRVVAPERAAALEHPPSMDELVIYELHVGTFSPEGSFASTVPYLAPLAELGFSAIELMPIAVFAGAPGWG